MAIRLTLEIIQAAAWHQADMSMRKHGRKAWNEEDHERACRHLYKLMKYLPAPYPEIAERQLAYMDAI